MTAIKKPSRLKKIGKFMLYLIGAFIIASLVEHFIKYKNPDFNQIDLPELSQLDAYVTTQESSVGEITDGAEKIIEWYDASKTKTEYAVVYLHGYSATRQETAPLASDLAQSLKANAFHTRLAGHGLHDSRMVEGTLKQWKIDVMEAYKIGAAIGEKVILVSVSTGGTLSTWLMGELESSGQHNVAAQILVSPNFEIRDTNGYIIDWPFGIGKFIAGKVTGDQRSWKPHNAMQDKYWATDYHIDGLTPLMQAMKAMKKVDKGSLQVPSLFIHSTKDTVISVPAITEAFAAYGSPIKEIRTYDESTDPSNHVIAGDILSPSSTLPIKNMMLEFIQKNKI